MSLTSNNTYGLGICFSGWRMKHDRLLVDTIYWWRPPTLVERDEKKIPPPGLGFLAASASGQLEMCAFTHQGAFSIVLSQALLCNFQKGLLANSSPGHWMNE